MTVYVITKGEYSDYGICAVTLDKDMAERLRLEYSSSYVQAQIEEYETDEHPSSIGEYHCHEIVLTEDSKLYYCDDYLSDKVPNDRVYHGGRYYRTTVIADDKDKALKIAIDRIAKYKAQELEL